MIYMVIIYFLERKSKHCQKRFHHWKPLPKFH